MKIKPEHVEALRALFVSAIDKVPARAEYIKAGMTDKRWHWDVMHAARFASTELMHDIYKYANDDHIDTALRVVAKAHQ